MRFRSTLTLLASAVLVTPTAAVMERGDYPWGTELRSYYDQEMAENLGKVQWLLNLGPTGIRARIYPDKPEHLVVKYVFQDADSPAKDLVNIDDVIVGANGEKFRTPHRFGRNLPDGGGWDGPMMELAGHIEDSQGADGLLTLIVWPAGHRGSEKEVPIQLEAVGRFAPTFPYNCPRSTRMLEDLCDFIVMDYESGNWKKENQFYGGAHGHAHQLLALMASGNPKYDRVLKDAMERYHGKRYDPTGGGFQTWGWGFDSIIMSEWYLKTGDRKVLPALESVAAAMPLGCFNKNGIYTHRSELNLRITGRKPYASIAAISGLQMTGMSLMQVADLSYDETLYQNIHQHYLNSATPAALNIAYAFSNADRFNDSDITHRHAIIQLHDPTKGRSGKGPGHVVPTGMEGIGTYDIVWPTKADHRWKPTDWIAKEADTNILTEHKGDGIRRVDRNHPDYVQAPEPSKPYETTRSGGHLAPVGMGALAHLIGNDDKPSWHYLGHHAANTCALKPGNAFDGHASSNLAAFWSVLGAARSDQPETLRAYFDYMKTFLILSETHNGGLILQPWGRDRPGCNSDVSYGPRTLPTATGAILLALGKRELHITGKGTGGGAELPTDNFFTRPARKLPDEHRALLGEALLTALAEISHEGLLKPVPVDLSKARTAVWLARVEPDRKLTFQAPQGDKTASFAFDELTIQDHAALAGLAAKYRADDPEAQATAGIYAEITGDTRTADAFYAKAGSEIQAKLGELFE